MSNYNLGKKIVITKSAVGTRVLAKEIAGKLIKQRLKDEALVVVLQGDLGSGKTTFIQGLAEGLGAEGRITSPTFVIMKKSEIRNPKSETNSNFQNSKFKIFKNFYHFDCYRIDKPKEILELGWQEIIADPKNIVAIEWPERIKKFLPKETIRLNFKFLNKNQREIKI